jgi:hypothetical protein
VSAPWADGPRELLQHAADHLDVGGDFDRRIAMISIDNAVELLIKTWLGLPKRSRGTVGPGRKELEAASESFPALLDLLDKHTSGRLSGVDLGDVEWYHRLRNQMYHNGNGITVERSKVEAYFQIAKVLYEDLFSTPLNLDDSGAQHTKTGKFLSLWASFDHGFRQLLPPKEGPAYYWKKEYLESISAEAAELWERLTRFRNELVHGLGTPSAEELDQKLADLRRLMTILDIPPA